MSHEDPLMWTSTRAHKICASLQFMSISFKQPIMREIIHSDYYSFTLLQFIEYTLL